MQHTPAIKQASNKEYYLIIIMNKKGESILKLINHINVL